MSQRSTNRSYRADSGRVMRPKAPQRGAPRTDYTLAHAGRQVRLGPVTFWVAVGSLVIMATWSLATGTYFAFHDDVLTRLIARQKRQQFAYEDRIAELRVQVDRITSRQLLDQEQFEQKLKDVMRRQATLESRASILATMPDPNPTGSIKRPPAPVREPQSDAKLKGSPISSTVTVRTQPARDASLDSRLLAAMSRRFAAANKPAVGVVGTLARVQASLDRIEALQTATLDRLQERYDSKAKRMHGVLADLGIKGKSTAVIPAAIGGPFVPVKLPHDAGPFQRQLHRVNIARAKFDRLARTLAAVPVRKPLSGDIDLSSGFGVRTDPFLGRPAMHTGLDFRGDVGEAVHATANGKVVTAGWSGGYGKMVEIDHGNGLSTRYGHLSEIDVRVGQSVRIGQTVGRVGSTGRSTGPHLHYETRIDGEAVDPQKFLRAGLKLGLMF